MENFQFFQSHSIEIPCSGNDNHEKHSSFKKHTNKEITFAGQEDTANQKSAFADFCELFEANIDEVENFMILNVRC